VWKVTVWHYGNWISYYCHTSLLVNHIYFSQFLRNIKLLLKKLLWAGCWWLTLIILATKGTEIRRIVVWSQPGQTVARPYLGKNPTQERASGVPQSIGLEFKPQYQKKKKKRKINLLLFSPISTKIVLNQLMCPKAHKLYGPKFLNL
jgi:hypothetical protein